MSDKKRYGVLKSMLDFSISNIANIPSFDYLIMSNHDKMVNDVVEMALKQYLGRDLNKSDLDETQILNNVSHPLKSTLIYKDVFLGYINTDISSAGINVTLSS